MKAKLSLLLAASMITVNCGKNMSAQTNTAAEVTTSHSGAVIQQAPIIDVDALLAGQDNTAVADANNSAAPDLSQVLNVIGSISNTNTSTGLGSLFGGLFGQTGATSGIDGIVGGLLGGGNQNAGSGTCSAISSLLGIGSMIFAGGNPIIGATVPQIANMLLGCGGSTSGLAGLLPTGSSGITQVIGLLSNVMLQHNQGANPFSALLNIKNPSDIGGMLSILTGLVGQGGNPQLQSLLQMVQTYQGFLTNGSVAPACGSMNPVACQVFGLINQIRSQNKLPAFSFNPNCAQASQDHSQDLSLNSILSHIGSDGSNPADRLAGFNGIFGTIAESIIKGKKLTAADAVQTLLSSPQNAQNILSKDLKSLGVGFFDGIFTQCFTK